jgi:hypothetical protein
VIEKDRAVFTGQTAVIPADTDATVSRQDLSKEPPLFLQGFLNAQDVGLRTGQGLLDRLLSDRPSVLCPGRPTLGPMKDVPRQNANRRWIRLCGRDRASATDGRPDNQAEPASERARDGAPPHPAGSGKDPFQPGWGLRREPPATMQRHHERCQEGKDGEQNPLSVPKRLQHKDRPRPAAEQDGMRERRADDGHDPPLRSPRNEFDALNLGWTDCHD